MRRTAAVLLVAILAGCPGGGSSGDDADRVAQAERLVKELDTPDKQVRDAAASRIFLLGPPVVPVLAKALVDPSENVRNGAGRALGDAISEWPADCVATIPELEKHLADSRADVRRRALALLAGFKKRAAPSVPAIGPCFTDADGSVRLCALNLAAEIGPDAAPLVSAIVLMLADKSDEVRFQAAHALGAIGPGAAGAVPALVKALGDRDVSRTKVWQPIWGSAAAAAARALGEIKAQPSVAIPGLVAALDGADPDGKVDSSVKLASSAAWALGEFGAAATPAIPSLRAAMKATEGETWMGGVHGTAAESLRKIRGLPHWPPASESPEACGFSAAFPSTPTVRTDKAEDSVTVRSFLAEKGGETLAVSAAEADDGGADKPNAEALLDGARDLGVKRARGRLVSEVAGTLQGRPVRDLVVQTDDRVMRIRLCLDKQRLFTVVHGRPSGKGDAEESPFVASFKLLH